VPGGVEPGGLGCFPILRRVLGPRGACRNTGRPARRRGLAARLHRQARRELTAILDRCHGLEQRAAAVYRSYATACRDRPDACALWTGLAREEEGHARSVATARLRVPPPAVERTTLEGWEAALAEVDERLGIAERLGADASLDARLSAALELEMSALEAARHAALAAARAPEPDDQAAHAERLAAAAERLSDDPQVGLQVALMRARARLRRI